MNATETMNSHATANEPANQPIKPTPFGWMRGHLASLLTLKAQLTAILLTLSLLSGAICAVALSVSASNALRENAIAQNSLQMTQLAHNLSVQISELEQVASALSTSDAIKQVTNYQRIENYASATAFLDYVTTLSEFAMRNTLADSLFLYQESGVIIGRDTYSNIFIREGLNDRQIKNRATYQSEIFDATRENAFHMAFLGTVSKGLFYYLNSTFADYPTLAFGYRFQPEYYKSYMVIAVLAREAEVRSLYADQHGALDTRYLIDSAGTVVSHADARALGDPAPLFREEWLTGKAYYTARASDGEGYLVTCSPVGASGLYLVSEMPQSEILRDIAGMNRKMALCVLLMALILPPVSILLIRRVLRPMRELSASMHRMELGELDQQAPEGPNNEIGLLIRQYNRMAQSIRQLTEQNRQNAAARRQAEIQALQAYINPHFLHNTILTLRWMAVMVNANRLADALTSFGAMLAPLYATRRAMWQLREERAFIENYIKIMNYRYGGGVQVQIELPESLSERMILKFVMQPLIENAFTYGIDPGTGAGDIRIRFASEGEKMRVEVSDRGGGMEAEKLAKLRGALRTEFYQYGAHGMGLPNVAWRIRLYYGEQSDLTVESDKSGTRVAMTLPDLAEEEPPQGENRIKGMNAHVSGADRGG